MEAEAERDAIQQRVTALEVMLRTAIELLDDICGGHRDPTAAEYNQCDSEPCAFCEDVAALRAALPSPEANG